MDYRLVIHDEEGLITVQVIQREGEQLRTASVQFDTLSLQRYRDFVDRRAIIRREVHDRSGVYLRPRQLNAILALAEDDNRSEEVS